MGVLMDLLFGRKAWYEDQKIGKLSTRIRGSSTRKKYLWHGANKPDGKNQVDVSLIGNLNGPDPNRLKLVYQIIDSFSDILAVIQKDATTANKLAPEYSEKWKNGLYISSVMDMGKYRNNFFVMIDSLEGYKKTNISFFWQAGGEISEIEVR